MECNLNPDDVRIFSGRSHPELAASIAFHLGIPLESTHFSRFSNDNLYIQLGASVRSRSVYIVQSMIPPVSEHLLELLMMLDIARGAGAREIHAIIPYFSYARSDKKNAPRISITARLIADLLETAGATHVMTMTLHSPQVHGFFRIPTDPLTARVFLLTTCMNYSTWISLMARIPLLLPPTMVGQVLQLAWPIISTYHPSLLKKHASQTRMYELVT